MEHTQQMANALLNIEKVIAQGPYQPEWESLSRYPVPAWYREAKFGIFIHWGVYSVPAYFSEWYCRLMYYHGNPVYWHHCRKYGKDFSYREFIPMFRAEKFDAQQWVQMLKAAGARFIMPVAEHHDGFKMYDSALSDWTAVKMGPHRDILQELKTACEAEDVIFSTSSHRAEHFWFMNGARTVGFQNEITQGKHPDFYGDCVNVHKHNNLCTLLRQEHGIEPTQAWLEDWLVSSCELIDRYKPASLFFDWWVSYKAFRPYTKRFLAYYYNRSVEWGKEICVYYKSDAVMYNCAIFDRERGQLPGISPYIWQGETSTAYNAWSYCTTNRFKTPLTIICNLLDVISKNGCFVLNVGPKADGTFCEEEQHILRVLGEWTARNAEGIWGTQPYKVFGEGKKQKSGSFHEKNRYTGRDYRFTCKPGAVYAFALCPKGKKKFSVRSLADSMDLFHCVIKRVSILGEENQVQFSQDKHSLTLCLPERVETDLPICFKLEVD